MVLRTAPATRDLATLAETILAVGRKIHVQELDDPDVVRLINLESLVMRHIDLYPGISPTALSRDLGLRSSNTSAALRSLEGKGLIARRGDTSDRRAVHLDPTPLARTNLKRVRAAWARLLEPLVPADLDLTSALAVLSALDSGLDGALAETR